MSEGRVPQEAIGSLVDDNKMHIQSCHTQELDDKAATLEAQRIAQNHKLMKINQGIRTLGPASNQRENSVISTCAGANSGFYEDRPSYSPDVSKVAVIFLLTLTYTQMLTYKPKISTQVDNFLVDMDDNATKKEPPEVCDISAAEDIVQALNARNWELCDQVSALTQELERSKAIITNNVAERNSVIKKRSEKMKTDLNRLLRDGKETFRRQLIEKDHVIRDQAAELATKNRYLAQHTAMTDELVKDKAAEIIEKDSAVEFLTTRCMKLLAENEGYKNSIKEKEILEVDIRRCREEIKNLTKTCERLYRQLGDCQGEFSSLVSERDCLETVQHALRIERDKLRAERDGFEEQRDSLAEDSHANEQRNAKLQAKHNESDCSVLLMLNRLESASAKLHQSIDTEVAAQRQRLARDERWSKML